MDRKRMSNAAERAARADLAARVCRRDQVASSSPVRGAAVLFSGGDSPGMNALLRFLARLGLSRYGVRLLGVKDGYAGLVSTSARIERGELDCQRLRTEMEQHVGPSAMRRRDQDIIVLDHISVSGLAGRGGIVLGAARCPEFVEVHARRRVADLLEDLEVDALIAVGGNGTLHGARQFAAESGITVVGIPATIDNDVIQTELALGFDTAVNNTMRAIEQINDTADAHHRIMVVETMGRNCGNLARAVALTAGAEIVVSPERGLLTPAKMQGIARRLERSFDQGQSHAIVVVAEGVEPTDGCSGGPAACLGRFLEHYFHTGATLVRPPEVRVNVLGHLQRGGSPSAADRILAAQFAEAAWEAIMELPPQSGVLGLRSGRVGLGAFEEPPLATAAMLQDAVYALQKSASKWV